MHLQKTIEARLQDSFKPVYLKVENESHKHSFASPGGESHFKVTIVSHCFENKNLLERQRQVYKVLSSEVEQIHALAQHTFTPLEWEERERKHEKGLGKKTGATSPPCAKTGRKAPS